MTVHVAYAGHTNSRHLSLFQFKGVTALKGACAVEAARLSHSFILSVVVLTAAVALEPVVTIAWCAY